ncbi:MAG: GspH/FimT family pseudopilin [Proteobacteria bacterium]|jgi:type IV fimbrial biogenesis protein FimT|nr:GspH/FimT family pseudopilin [Pseudomonadota bacterium]
MLSGLPGTRSRGFTLVELMTALGISAILVAIAVPTMRAFIENSRIRAASESLQNGLALARNEAVRRNERIEFVAQATGWVVRVPGAATPLQEASGREGRTGLTLTMTPDAADRITFDSFGRSIANADGSASLSQVDIVSTNPPSSGNYKPLRIQIQATGAARLCNPAVAVGNPAVCL